MQIAAGGTPQSDGRKSFAFVVRSDETSDGLHQLRQPEHLWYVGDNVNKAAGDKNPNFPFHRSTVSVQVDSEKRMLNKQPWWRFCLQQGW